MATFTNQASVTYNGTTIRSNIVTGQMNDNLSALKTALLDTYTNEGTLTYAISLVNSGTDAITGVTLTDDLGAYSLETVTAVPLTYQAGSLLAFVDGELQTQVSVESTQPLTVTGITIPAGGSAVIVYETRVNTFADPTVGGTIINTVTLSGGSLVGEVTAQETVTAASEPKLEIVKEISPGTVKTGDTITYVMTVYNEGNTPITAEDDLVLIDTFNPILTGISVTLSGAPLPQSAYTYDQLTGEFATVAGQVTVPAATYAQDPDTAAWTITPGETVITITGNIG